MQPRRVPSDDYRVTEDGVDYFPHAGEWVEVVGTRSIGELKSSWAFNRLSVDFDALKGEPDEVVRTAQLLEDHFEDLLRWTAPRLLSWNWSDAQGRPLPPLDGSPEPLRHLSPEELHYLRLVIRGEGPAEEGKG